MKGRTCWFPRNVHPVRNGEYECAVRVSRAVPLIRWFLHWDGIGFKVPFPMNVIRWRGLTANGYAEAVYLRRLTDDQIREVIDSMPGRINGMRDEHGLMEFARRIEGK